MMTKKQYKVFAYIKDFTDRTGVSPTYHNISQVLNLKTDYEAYTYVRRIIAQGYLRKTDTAPPLLQIVRYPTPAELAETAPAAPARGVVDREALSLQRGGSDAEKRERFAYNRGVRDAKEHIPQNIVEAYERGIREGKRQNSVDLSKAYKEGYAAAVVDTGGGLLRPLPRRA